MSEYMDDRIDAWHKVAAHPFFEAAYATNDSLINSMLKMLDRVHDAIVIDRADLPEVTGRDMRSPYSGYVKFADGLHRVEVNDDFRRLALAYLAADEYHREHPPVDEAQVKALTEVLYAATADPDDIDVPHVARRLVERGVRVEATS